MLKPRLKDIGTDLPRKKLGIEPTIHPTATVMQSELGPWTEIGERTSLIETTMGDASYVVHDSEIIYTTIGKYCSIASHVRINPGNHPLERPALHHFTYRSQQFEMGEDDDEFFNWRRASAVILGHDVWVGHGAVILPGVNIGTGAVIAAGAVVSKDVAPFAIVTGVPSSHLRFRFPSDVCDGLLKIQWWDWPRENLMAALPDFRVLSAGEFVRKYVSG